MIYDLTFTANPGIRELGTIVELLKERTRASDPKPHLLHISRHSRDLYATSYYGAGAVFVIYDLETLEAWLRLLPAKHRNLIVDIRCIVWRSCPRDATDACRWPHEARQVQYCLEHAGLDVGLAMKIQLGKSDYVYAKH